METDFLYLAHFIERLGITDQSTAGRVTGDQSLYANKTPRNSLSSPSVCTAKYETKSHLGMKRNHSDSELVVSVKKPRKKKRPFRKVVKFSLVADSWMPNLDYSHAHSVHVPVSVHDDMEIFKIDI